MTKKMSNEIVKRKRPFSALERILENLGVPGGVVLSAEESGRFVRCVSVVADNDLKGGKGTGDLMVGSTVLAERGRGVLSRPVPLVVAENEHYVRSGSMEVGGRRIGFVVVDGRATGLSFSVPLTLRVNAKMDDRVGRFSARHGQDLILRQRNNGPVVILTGVDVGEIQGRLGNVGESRVFSGAAKVLNVVGDVQEKLEESGVVGGREKRRVG